MLRTIFCPKCNVPVTVMVVRVSPGAYGDMGWGRERWLVKLHTAGCGLCQQVWRWGDHPDISGRRKMRVESR